MMPRFWVLTDHGRGQIVLVLRGLSSSHAPFSLYNSLHPLGTMSVNEIVADLTCEPEEFEPATTICSSTDPSSDPSLDQISPSSSIPFPSASQCSTSVSPTASPLLPHSRASPTMAPRYYVHGGMLRMARAMGGTGKPVQVAVKEALSHNPGYGMSWL